jgi:hypothetical protein
MGGVNVIDFSGSERGKNNVLVLRSDLVFVFDRQRRFGRDNLRFTAAPSSITTLATLEWVGMTLDAAASLLERSNQAPYDRPSRALVSESDLELNELTLACGLFVWYPVRERLLLREHAGTGSTTFGEASDNRENRGVLE